MEVITPDIAQIALFNFLLPLYIDKCVQQRDDIVVEI